MLSEILLTLLLAAHLIAVNIAMAGPLLCLALKRREVNLGDDAAGQVGRQLAKASLGSLAVGSLLGGGLLAVVWIGGAQRYLAALGAIPASRYWFALAEIIFYVACMSGVLWTWQRRPARTVLLVVLSILAATDLMFHFPPMFTIVATAARRPELVQATIDRTTYYHLLLDGEVLSRVTHVWLASVAVTAMTVCLIAMAGTRGDDRRRGLASWAAKWALGATLLQLPTGLWMLLVMPGTETGRMLGEDAVATTLFALSLVIGFHLLQRLAAMALGDVERKATFRTAAAMGAMVLLMVATLERVGASGTTLGGTRVIPNRPDRL